MTQPIGFEPVYDFGLLCLRPEFEMYVWCDAHNAVGYYDHFLLVEWFIGLEYSCTILNCLNVYQFLNVRGDSAAPGHEGR